VTPIFRCIIPGVPIPQRRARSTKNGRHYYPKGCPSKAYRDACAYQFRSEWGSAKAILVPVTLKCWVWGLRGNGDLSNVRKSLEDSLVDAGVLENDTWRYVRRCEDEGMEGGPPRVEIEIWAYAI
jgi:Holliday junction resolvase RusA-like endonuclease